MESQKQPMKAVDSLGQGFSDPPLINLPAVLSTDTHGHLCHWICPWASPVVPRAAVLLLSEIWMFLFFSHGSQHSRFPFWLSELSAVTACASCLHPQQHWRYQSNTPSAWEVYHYQLRRCRPPGNFNQQRHFHIQRDKDISILLSGHQKRWAAALGTLPFFILSEINCSTKCSDTMLIPNC